VEAEAKMPRTSQISDPLVEPQEVADYLLVPVATLAQWRYLGQGPRFHKVGRFVRYRWSDVETWLAEQGRTSTRTA
jgi:hypothetical protein